MISPLYNLIENNQIPFMLLILKPSRLEAYFPFVQILVSRTANPQEYLYIYINENQTHVSAKRKRELFAYFS